MKKLYSDAMSKLYETIIKLFVFLLVKFVSKKKNVSRVRATISVLNQWSYGVLIASLMNAYHTMIIFNLIVFEKESQP